MLPYDGVSTAEPAFLRIEHFSVQYFVKVAELPRLRRVSCCSGYSQRFDDARNCSEKGRRVVCSSRLDCTVSRY